MHSNKIHPRAQLPIWMFGVLGILAAIRVIAAAFNYVNLTIALSLDRAREIGVCKTLGAHRGHVSSAPAQRVQSSTLAQRLGQVAEHLVHAWQTVTFPGQAVQARTVVGIVNDFEVSGIAEVYTNNGRFGREKPVMLYWSPENAGHALVRSQSGNLAALRAARLNPMLCLRDD